MKRPDCQLSVEQFSIRQKMSKSDCFMRCLPLCTGEEVTFECDNGYILFGGDRRICQEDGSWSGSLPECSKIQNISIYICSLLCSRLLLSQHSVFNFKAYFARILNPKINDQSLL